jgi:hypothetical protein
VTTLKPGEFPLWASPDCPHLPERQQPDGACLICLDCGVLRVMIVT